MCWFVVMSCDELKRNQLKLDDTKLNVVNGSVLFESSRTNAKKAERERGLENLTIIVIYCSNSPFIRVFMSHLNFPNN